MPKKRRRLSGRVQALPSADNAQPRSAPESFQALEPEADAYDNMERVNNNIQQTQVLLMHILRGVQSLTRPQVSEAEVQRAIRQVISEHFVASFESVDSLEDLLDNTKVHLRDTIWNDRLPAKYKATVGDDEQKVRKAYMLKRIHNRFTRLLPGLINFMNNAGGNFF